MQISSQTSNNFMTALISPNSYIFKQLNNMDEAKVFKKKHNNWTNLYHKTIKEMETMINIQKQVRNMIMIAKEANTMITEIERTILKASTNNQMMNVTNILGISEDLQNLIQCNMENKTYQIQ